MIHLVITKINSNSRGVICSGFQNDVNQENWCPERVYFDHNSQTLCQKIIQIFMVRSSLSCLQLSCGTIFSFEQLIKVEKFQLYRLFRVNSFTQG